MEEDLYVSFFDGEDVLDDVVHVDFNIVAHLHQQLQFFDVVCRIALGSGS